MRIDGEHRFDLPRSVMWEHLLDPASLQGAIPGCTAFDEVAADTWEVTAQVGVGPVRGAFTGRVELRDRQPESRYTLIASGQGRPGGGTGEAVIDLTDDGDGTHLRYEADVSVRGAIARVGGRLLTASARTMARQFFDAIEKEAKTAMERSAAT
ncbi:MAG: carbon monoxide dehydrogenase subunit G [Chloroflexi bacterium]|nr:carbon monoxide dehydrogenase subunit G [Chloroflexota bacterium]